LTDGGTEGQREISVAFFDLKVVKIMIYLDNAATSGYKPEAVIREVENAMKKYSVNPGRSGHNLSILASEKVYSIRKKVAEFFGAKDP
jgi:selenocysteine lyase/cysteine desulfurase